MNDTKHYTLLTPGPLTTSLVTREAMLRDWGSWDSEFTSLTQKVLQQLIRVLENTSEYACIPLQGSGTFAVEAAIGTLVPANGCVLIPNNGAYCQRIITICKILNVDYIELPYADDQAFVVKDIENYLAKHPEITHVAVVHCETSAGILNPIDELANMLEQYQKGMIIDAMSSFGALPIPVHNSSVHAVIAASGKCLEGVPGVGFVFVRNSVLFSLEHSPRSLSLDLFDQWQYMQKTGQWRFTPPTHVVAALSAALDQYFQEGGLLARLEKYITHATLLVEKMQTAGLHPFLPEAIRSPIIITFVAPCHEGYNFSVFYEKVKSKGYILYPGKLTERDTFRVGCIGVMDESVISGAVDAMIESLIEMGIFF